MLLSLFKLTLNKANNIRYLCFDSKESLLIVNKHNEDYAPKDNNLLVAGHTDTIEFMVGTRFHTRKPIEKT